MDFFSSRVDLEPHNYFFNTFNLHLEIQQNEILRPKIKIKDKKDIENLFNFNHIGSYFFYPKKVYNIYHLYLISIIFCFKTIL